MSVLKWHGGKHYLTQWLGSMIPIHLTYCEPYAGGLSLLLSRNPEGISEIVNDMDGDLVNFWQVLRSPRAYGRFKELCEATPFSEPTYFEACRTLMNSGVDPATRAWAFFTKCRQSMAGRMDSFSPMSTSRTRRGMNEQVSAWLSAIDELPAAHERLKRVAILLGRARRTMEQVDSPKTFFYLDPPYLPETRTAKDVYKYEMDRTDHEMLLRYLADIKGKFMLSGYTSALYRHYARENGWHSRSKDLSNNSGKGDEKNPRTEWVWMNYNPLN